MLGMVLAGLEGMLAGRESFAAGLAFYGGCGGVLGCALVWLRLQRWFFAPLRWGGSAFLIALAITWSGEWDGKGTASPSGDAPDLVLITTDTVRADRWQWLMESKLQEWGASTFERAWSTSGLTAPAHASLFTGDFPHQHGVVNNGMTLIQEEASLPSLLQAAGWTTLGFPSVLHLDPAFGFADGFDVFGRTESGVSGALRPLRDWWLVGGLIRLVGAGSPTRLDGDTVTAALHAWDSAEATNPRFLWVHLFGAHWPYHESPVTPQPRCGEGWPAVPTPGFHPDRVRSLRLGYDQGVAATGEQVARLVDHLLDCDAERPLWIVGTADHGEFLGEHGATDHGDLAYGEGLRVPLWVVGPSQRSVSSTTTVSHVDALPSFIDMAGLAPLDIQQGRSWLPLLQGASLPPVPVYAETRTSSFDNATCILESIQLTRNLVVTPKLMAARGVRASEAVPEDPPWSQAWEAYDLREDPHALVRLEGRPPRAAARIAESMDRFLSQRGLPPEEASDPGLAPEVLAALRALGYHEEDVE